MYKLIEQQKIWTVQLNNYQEISKETAVFLIRAVLKRSVFFFKANLKYRSFAHS